MVNWRPGIYLEAKSKNHGREKKKQEGQKENWPSERCLQGGVFIIKKLEGRVYRDQLHRPNVYHQREAPAFTPYHSYRIAA